MVSPLVQAMTFQNSVQPAQQGIAPTDVVGSYKLASDVAEQNYKAQLAAQQAKFGGMAGLGGAGVLAFGPSAAKKLFGSGASTAGGLPGADGAAGMVGPTAGDSFMAPLGSGASLGDASTFPFASLGNFGGLGGSTGWPGFGIAEATPLAADFGGTAAATAAADAGTATLGEGMLASSPEWLTALLPFLLA